MSRKKPNLLNRAVSLNVRPILIWLVIILEIGDQKTKEKGKDRCITTFLCMCSVHTGFCKHALDLIQVKSC